MISFFIYIILHLRVNSYWGSEQAEEGSEGDPDPYRAVGHQLQGGDGDPQQ